MDKMVNGTSVELIRNWILAIEKDIERNEFYCFEDRDDRRISSLNKARLSVMYDIFCITSNDYSEGQTYYFTSYKGSVKEATEKVKKYLQTMKELLEIN